jgi:hypothetical protein
MRSHLAIIDALCGLLKTAPKRFVSLFVPIRRGMQILRMSRQLGCDFTRDLCQQIARELTRATALQVAESCGR